MRAEIEKRVWAMLNRQVVRYKSEIDFIVSILIDEGGLNQTAIIERCVSAGISTTGKSHAAITKLNGICWFGMRTPGDGASIIYRVTDIGLIYQRASNG